MPARPPEDDMLPAPLERRYGYRGRALTFLGLVWLLVGISVLYSPGADPEHLVVIETVPMWLRVLLWWGAGVFALVTAWWPTGADRWGFVALVIPAAVRALSYGWTAFVGFLTTHILPLFDVNTSHFGDRDKWINALAWGVIVAFVWLLSSWPEPADPTNGEETDR